MLCSYPGSAHPSSDPCGPDGEMGEAFFSPLADDSSFNGKVKANRKKKKKRGNWDIRLKYWPEDPGPVT